MRKIIVSSAWMETEPRLHHRLSVSRLAVLPATSHTAVITQPDLLFAFMEPFLKGETPKGFFEGTK